MFYLFTIDVLQGCQLLIKSVQALPCWEFILHSAVPLPNILSFHLVRFELSALPVFFTLTQILVRVPRQRNLIVGRFTVLLYVELCRTPLNLDVLFS